MSIYERGLSNLPENIREEAVERRKNMQKHMLNSWGHSELGIEAMSAMKEMRGRYKNGLFAKIPIRCKTYDCPYAESCILLENELAPEGEFCPVETYEIEERIIGYDEDFDLETASFTDRCIVTEIITCDIMMERCKALMSKEGVPVIEMVAGISAKGDTYTAPAISKYWEAYEKAHERRSKSYDLMMATRKNKKNHEKEEQVFTDILKDAINVIDIDESDIIEGD